MSLLLMLIVLAACNANTPVDSAATPEATPDPEALLFEALANIRAQQTFRMEIVTSGTEFPFEIDLGFAAGSATFVRGIVQYVVPDTVQASARIVFGRLPTDILAFARGERQWLSVASSGWTPLTFAPDFNPAALTETGGAFESALSSLRDLRYVGEETLDVGNAPVYHLQGTAEGEAVAAMLVNLVILPQVAIDVYIHRETRLPLRITLAVPNTETAETGPTTWMIDVYDFNAAPELNDPEAQ